MRLAPSYPPTHSHPFIRTVQDLLGHANVDTTMIYLQVMKRSGPGGPSSLDLG